MQNSWSEPIRIEENPLPETPRKRDKRKRLLLGGIALLLCAAIVAAVALLSAILWLPPKDLGVRPDGSALSRALEAMNASATSAEEIRTFSLDGDELTAVLQALPPEAQLLRDAQVALTEDNLMEISGAVAPEQLMTLLPSLRDFVPIPLPEQVNLHSTLRVSAYQGIVTVVPETLELGPLSLTSIFRDREAREVFTRYAAQAFRAVEGLDVRTLTIAEGELSVEAALPEAISSLASAVN